MAAGSYLRTKHDDPGAERIDAEALRGRILKTIGGKVLALPDLAAAVGLSPDLVREAVEDLRGRGMIEGDEAQIRLTPLGYRAHYIVAA